MTQASVTHPAGRRLRMLVSGMPASIWLCSLWIVVVIFVGLTAQWIAPYDYLQQAPLTRFTPPGILADHPLGTDYIGRDLLSNLIVATQTTLTIALTGSLICAVIGTTLGFLAAHFGGWVDNIIMGFAEAKVSIPFIIIALGVLAFFGSSPLLFVLLMGISFFERFARLTRGLVLSANQEGYAEAARIVGVPSLRIYVRHVLPNIAGPLIVQLTRELFPRSSCSRAD